jgi:uncharacterized membrane protein
MHSRKLIAETRPPELINPPPMADDFISPWLFFGGVYLIASIGGIAALLRSKEPLSARYVFSALLNSGIAGLIVGMVMWHVYEGKQPYLIFAISAAAGLGGATTLDVLFHLVMKKLGLKNPPKVQIDE